MRCTPVPSEATYLLLPQDERLAAKVLLNPEAWEVTYGKSGAEGPRREVVALRPVQAPQTARALLVLQSGLTIHLKLLAHTKPGMLSVTWDIPALAPVPSASAPAARSISVPRSSTVHMPMPGIRSMPTTTRHAHRRGCQKRCWTMGGIPY